MRLWKTLASLAVLVMCVTRCDLGTPPQASGGGTEVEGIIVDQHGNPAAGIWVRVFPDSSLALSKGSATTESFLAIRDSAKTNSNGVFKLPNLPSGTYNLVATLKRNDTTLSLFRRSIVVSGNLNLGTDTLRVAGSLVVNVALSGGNVGGALCYIPGSPYFTLSSLTGQCTLNGLPPGTYRVSVSMNGLGTSQTGNVVVISFQVTPGGTVTLISVNPGPGPTPGTDSAWKVTVDAIPTLFIGDATAGFRDSIAFTGLREANLLATWDNQTSSMGRNFHAGDNQLEPRARVAQTLTVDLRGINKNFVPSKGSARVFDTRGMLTHSDTSTLWTNLHRTMSKYRRAAVTLNFADSVTTTGSTNKQALKITRVLIKKNGTPVLDSSRSAGFAGMRTHAFVLEYLNPASADSLEILAYGNFSDASGLMYSGTVKLQPNTSSAPGLTMQWVGSSAVTVPLCLIAANLPPTLVSPANLATGVATTTAISWDTGCGATGYRVQVATDSAFTALVVNDSNVISTSKNLSLQASKVYYWRVASKVNGGVTGWSSVRRFTTAGAGTTLSAPNLLLPAQFATNVARPTQLMWDSVTGTTYYHVQVSKTTAFTTFAVNDSMLTSRSKTISTLEASTDYYWRVRARNGSNTSAYSTVFRFTTDANDTTITLIAPPLLLPTDSLNPAPVSPTFTWSPVPNAAYYQIQISTSNAFSSVPFQDSLVTGTSKTGFTLSNSTTYYWRVRAKSTSSQTSAGPWSATRRLTTEGGTPPTLASPVLMNPAAFAANVPTSVSFSWAAVSGASSYNLQISTSSSFATVLRSDSVSGITKSITGLSPNTNYYWRVLAKSGSNLSAYSEARAFTTSATATLGAPLLYLPEDAAGSVSLLPTLSWQLVGPTAVYHHLQISTSTSFTNLAFNDSLLADSSKTLTTALAGNTKYYWRVQSRPSSLANGTWSSIRSFTTTGSGAWSLRSTGTTQNLNAFAVRPADSLLVAVGNLGNILTSTNGITWTARTSGVNVNLRAVVWGGTQFVAVGDSGTVVTSPNGVTWTGTKYLVSGYPNLYGIIKDGSNYVAVGSAGKIVYSSDAVTWQSYTSPTTNILYFITSGGGKLVVGGASGVILSTPTGTTSGSVWTVRTSATTDALLAGVWSGSNLVITGAAGKVLTSPDGVTWTNMTSGTTNALYAIAVYNGTLKATGANGTILSSLNGLTWASESTGISAALYAISKFGTVWVAAGTGGSLLTSPL